MGIRVNINDVFICFLFFGVIACNERERKMDYYPDGHVRTEVNLVNGLRQGTETGYFKDGSPEWRKSYVNDSLDGGFFKYYPNKLILLKANFKHGKQSGDFFEYFEDGNLKQKGFFAKGRMNGLFLFYYHNGNKAVESLIQDDTTRFCVRYDSLGHATDKRRYTSLRIYGGSTANDSIKISEKIPCFISSKEAPIFALIGEYSTGRYGQLLAMKFNRKDSSYYYTFPPRKKAGRYLIKTLFYEKNKFPNHQDTLITLK